MSYESQSSGIVDRRTGDARERFWSKVDKSGECWLWTGGRNDKGYGIFNVGSRSRLAHRVSYELVNGPAPDGLYVLHSCDQPACVNPSHLRAGTQADNMRDMALRGRGHGSPLKGSAHGASRLTEQVVRCIRSLRASGVRVAAIARLFGVSESNIYLILRGDTWGHV